MEPVPTIDTHERLLGLLANHAHEELAEFLDTLSAQELVYAMSHLSKKDQVRLITMLSPEDAADVMEDIPESQAADLLEGMESTDAAAILQEMESDEQADVLMEIEEEEAEEILSRFSPEEAAEVRKRTSYAWDTAGGLLITEYLALPDDFTVQEVIAYFRARREEFQELHIKYLYVVSRDGVLRGIMPMQGLVMAEPQMVLRDIMWSDILTVREDMTLDELSNFFDTHDFYGVPVVNDQGQMLGLVLRKKVLEAYAEQVSIESMESRGIIGGEELRTMPAMERTRRRMSWLIINIFLNILAASVIAFYEETLSAVIALAVFLPIISDMSGNSGFQAVAVSMRELSLGTLRAREHWRVMRQELMPGLINGIVLGVMVGVTAWLYKGSLLLAAVVGASLAINTLMSVLLGGTIPLFIKRIGLDPALASGAILTTLTDMLGFFLTLLFASVVLQHFGGI